jgi:hypothetical protein
VPPEQGSTYATFISEQLEAEISRRSALDARGTGVVTVSGTLVTLTLAVGGFALSKSHKISTVGKVGVIGALALFVLASIAGIAASFLHEYQVADQSTLEAMLGSHWRDSEIDARNVCAHLDAQTVQSLRKGNNSKALQLTVALSLQVAAIAALGFTVAWELTH